MVVKVTTRNQKTNIMKRKEEIKLIIQGLETERNNLTGLVRKYKGIVLSVEKFEAMRVVKLRLEKLERLLSNYSKESFDLDFI